jgi:hypothetical protein
MTDDMIFNPNGSPWLLHSRACGHSAVARLKGEEVPPCPVCGGAEVVTYAANVGAK